MQNSLPQEFIKRIQLLYPENFEAILETFTKKKPSTFRVNTIKCNAKVLLQKLEVQGFVLENGPLADSFILRNKSQRELTETQEYKDGWIYIQGLSSMIPPLVLNPRENETVLDMCSAPGSKTTQMAAMMKNTGHIIANDMSRVRLYKLAANIQTLRVTNITTMHTKAQDLWKKFPQTFDKVLVDVPCSLEGRFFIDNPKTYREWSVKKVKTLAEHQKHILRSAVTCAKSGALIVYSTCTISPEENEEVIDWMLSKDPTLELMKVQLESVPQTPGILSWQGHNYNPEVKKSIRILPNNLYESFFLAVLKKN